MATKIILAGDVNLMNVTDPSVPFALVETNSALPTLSFATYGTEKAMFQFVRHDERNRSVPCAREDEGAAFDEIARRSAGFGTRLAERGDEVWIDLRT